MNSGEKAKNHKCRKSDIVWDRRVSGKPVDPECLAWFGECSQCDRQVYELYCQTERLHDANTGEKINED